MLQSMGSRRVGHNKVYILYTVYMIIYSNSTSFLKRTVFTSLNGCENCIQPLMALELAHVADLKMFQFKSSQIVFIVKLTL